MIKTEKKPEDSPLLDELAVAVDAFGGVCTERN